MARRRSTSLPFLLVPLAATLALTGRFSASAEPAGSTGRISVAHMQPPRSGLDPLSDDAFKLSRWSTAETLVTLNESGDATPGLATAWQRTSDTTWEITIREGVSFHNGEPLTAAAAANSPQAAIDSTPVPRILNGTALKVAVVDEHTLRITTGDPDPLLPQRLSSPQPGHLRRRRLHRSRGRSGEHRNRPVQDHRGGRHLRGEPGTLRRLLGRAGRR
ncbi:ABC transporter substrate-binding protein [Glutamicibacter halophytocola]|uniref:ABC transporter substrate-binding protein n=1 Tax=Glutamicibacter halophytocola TaxID=1933880 RepID=UPI00321B7EDA